MRLWIAALLALIAAPAFAAPGPIPVQVTVTRTGEAFVADFIFPHAAPAWGFFRSSPSATDNRSWRLRSWQVLTPGVTVQRRGKIDALIGANGRPVPRNVRVHVTPFTGHLTADYVPALRLGGDSIALFDGHFSAFSIDRAGRLDTLPAAVDPATVGDVGTRVNFRGNGLRLAGDVEGYRRGNSEGTYGLFGVPRALVRSGVATVIDSELPQWIANDLASYTPRVMAMLTARLGPSGVTEPTVLAAWEGAGIEGASMNGGSLKGLILMRFEGQSALKQVPALTDLAHWFIAHEAAHFWLGQSVRYKTPRDSWIMEGGADLLATRTAQRLDPRFNAKKQVNDLVRECATLAGQPVATALERNDNRSFYACGAVFALVAERANGGDFFAFSRRLIDANRADRELTAAEWYAALDRASGSTRHSAAIREIVEQGSREPASAIARLLAGAGISYTVDPKGVPQLQ
jgi:hypothetical protein